MHTLTNLITPTFLAFLIIVCGYLMGKIKLWNISLDLSAILIVAVLTGYFISVFSPQIVDKSFENDMSLFTKLGTTLFVSVIGLSSGLSITESFGKKSLFCFLIGVGMVIMAFTCFKIINLLDSEIDESLLLGILCGSLTSTPGLSTVCENREIISDAAILGYGCSYLFGVIGVVMFVQTMTRQFKITSTDKNNIENNINKRGYVESLVPIGISVVLGNIIGNMNFPLLRTSLGTSGGILCVSVFIGFIIGKLHKKFNNEHMNNFRNFGLELFFVGAGIPAGIRFTNAFEIKWFMYGIILTTVPILFGYFLSRFVFKSNIIDGMAIVSGGMTSTPAIGVLLGKFKIIPDLSMYSFTYVGALLAIVVSMPLLI